MSTKLTYKELEQRNRKLEKESFEHKLVDKRMARLNLVLRTVRNVNHLLVKENDRERLLQGICGNLVENRGYNNAWIALYEESGDLVASANAGLGKELLLIARKLKSVELIHCAKMALAQSKVVVMEDPLSTCSGCPLSKNYLGRGEWLYG